MASGMPKPMWASHDGGEGAVEAEVAVELQQRHQRDLVGHDEQADDEDEERVPAAELA